MRMKSQEKLQLKSLTGGGDGVVDGYQEGKRGLRGEGQPEEAGDLSGGLLGKGTLKKSLEDQKAGEKWGGKATLEVKAERKIPSVKWL